MKNKFLAILSVSLFLVFSCDNDDDEEAGRGATLVGVWGIVNGEEFSYLTLLSNNTFLYGEYDASVNFSTENGLEAGTYQYDSNDEEITFNVLYDDNLPEESGVGDIGTPVTLSAMVLDDGERLSLADGDLIFNKMDLTATTFVTGVWSRVDGDEFSYLTLLSSNTFLYAENSSNVNSSAQNGLEVGSFVYEPSMESLTFDITYDDNDPGNDSGIGDIGTPITIDAVLSNENNTLTFAGLQFTREL